MEAWIQLKRLADYSVSTELIGVRKGIQPPTTHSYIPIYRQPSHIQPVPPLEKLAISYHPLSQPEKTSQGQPVTVA